MHSAWKVIQVLKKRDFHIQ